MNTINNKGSIVQVLKVNRWIDFSRQIEVSEGTPKYAYSLRIKNSYPLESPNNTNGPFLLRFVTRVKVNAINPADAQEVQEARNMNAILHFLNEFLNKERSRSTEDWENELKDVIEKMNSVHNMCDACLHLSNEETYNIGTAKKCLLTVLVLTTTIYALHCLKGWDIVLDWRRCLNGEASESYHLCDEWYSWVQRSSLLSILISYIWILGAIWEKF